MHKIALIIGLICTITLNAFSQKMEIGAMGGLSGYIGDINQRNIFDFTDPAGGFFIRTNFNNFYSIRYSFMQGTVRAYDKNSNLPEQRLRNLSFESSITEVAATFEFNFFKFIISKKNFRFTPYTFAGIAVFAFNPKAELNGKMHELQPLGTEGQGTPVNSSKKYWLLNGAIPYGIGFKYNFYSKYTFGTELGYRSTFTDYLDDVGGKYANPNQLNSNYGAESVAFSDRSGEVNNGENIGRPDSQRGDMVKKDTYMFVGISFTYTFVRLRCPTFN